MEIKNIQKEHRPEKRNVPIALRITKTHSKFMKVNNISPTKLFVNALEELMQKKDRK